MASPSGLTMAPQLPVQSAAFQVADAAQDVVRIDGDAARLFRSVEGDRLQQTFEHHVQAARAGRLPKLKFVTGYSHYGIKRFDNYDDELWVGVDFSIPIFDGFVTPVGHPLHDDQVEAAPEPLPYSHP